MNKFIKKIKTLKSIKADEGFKFDLRKKMIEEAGGVTNLYSGRLQKQQGMSTLLILTNNLLIKRKNMLIPLILIIGLLGGGAGATYASQSSLPGDILYPVKIATEKAQTVLVIDDAKKADLHLQFSSERLEEVEELVKRGDKNPEHVKSAVGKHKEELARAQIILNDVPSKSEQSAKIAQRVSEVTAKNKVIIIKVSKDFEDDDDILSLLEDAWDDDTEHDDVVTMLLIQDILSGQNNSASQSATTNTTQTTAVVDAAAKNKVVNKIAEANHKIAEAERYVAKKELKGIDVTQAKAQVVVAKTLATDAQNLLNQNKYSEAFLKAKEAHKTAQIAKELAEHKYKEERDNDDDDDEDDEVIFLIPSATNVAPVVNTNQNSNTSITNTTNLNSNNPTSSTPVIIITDDEDDDRGDDDNDDDRDDNRDDK